jgi:hypothetical protein
MQHQSISELVVPNGHNPRAPYGKLSRTGNLVLVESFLFSAPNWISATFVALAALVVITLLWGILLPAVWSCEESRRQAARAAMRITFDAIGSLYNQCGRSGN